MHITPQMLRIHNISTSAPRLTPSNHATTHLRKHRFRVNLPPHPYLPLQLHALPILTLHLSSSRSSINISFRDQNIRTSLSEPRDSEPGRQGGGECCCRGIWVDRRFGREEELLNCHEVIRLDYDQFVCLEVGLTLTGPVRLSSMCKRYALIGAVHNGHLRD